MEDKKELKQALEYFDQFVNTALQSNIGVNALEVVKNYNVIRDELAKLLVLK